MYISGLKPLPHSRASAICLYPGPAQSSPYIHLLEIHRNIIHPSTPRSPQWAPSLRFPQQDPIPPYIYVSCMYMFHRTYSQLYGNAFCNRRYIYIYMGV